MAKKKKEVIDTSKAEMMTDEAFMQGTPEMFDFSEFNEEVISSGAEYWDFKTNKTFVGYYQGAIVARDDSDNFQKGDVIGFEFLPHGREIPVILPSNFLIEQAVGNCKKGDLLKVLFLGKKETGSGQPFSNFRITKLTERKK